MPTREEGYPKYIDWAVDTYHRRKPFDFDEYMKLTKEWRAKVLEEKSFWFGNPVVGRPGGLLKEISYDFNSLKISSSSSSSGPSTTRMHELF